jgi:hypothetical protein
MQLDEGMHTVTEILQPGAGEIPGDHYLRSTPETVLWGRLPCETDAAALRIRSGDSVTIDTVSHEGILEDHGKDPYSDLREGKQTVILAYARMTNSWPSIEPVLTTGPLDIAAAAQVARLLTDCGAEEFARNLVDEQLTSLYELLAAAPIPESVQQVLLGFAGRLEGRRT